LQLESTKTLYKHDITVLTTLLLAVQQHPETQSS
jgi:hypothetical protein